MLYIDGNLALADCQRTNFVCDELASVPNALMEVELIRTTSVARLFLCLVKQVMQVVSCYLLDL